jgi:hypothetical protein
MQRTIANSWGMVPEFLIVSLGTLGTGGQVCFGYASAAGSVPSVGRGSARAELSFSLRLAEVHMLNRFLRNVAGFGAVLALLVIGPDARGQEPSLTPRLAPAHPTLAIGSPAPDFELPGIDGRQHASGRNLQFASEDTYALQAAFDAHWDAGVPFYHGDRSGWQGAFPATGRGGYSCDEARHSSQSGKRPVRWSPRVLGQKVSDSCLTSAELRGIILLA